MLFKRQYLILSIILLIAAFLRFWQLGSNPPSLTWDEVAWGYNAYSLGIDGKDEFGKSLPIQYLESFGDFKPPIYAYLDILPIKLFGLNEFAVRFPSAFFGTLTVLLTYFLTNRIFFSKHSPPRSPFGHLGGVAKHHPRGETIALLSALILAISPWHINLSRAAFEANVASFFIVSGIWLFLAGVQDKKWYLILSVVSFILSMYTFNTARIVTPVMIMILILGFRKELLSRKKEAGMAAIVGMLLLIPTLQFLFSPQASLRFREVNIFSDSSVVEKANQEIANDGNIWWSKIIHNRRLGYTVEYVRHYLDNLNPQFLFIKGDGNPKFSTQVVGQMYLWDLPFFILGILFLIRKKEGKWWLIPIWLIVGILPAATARETPHALRIETTLPTFQILVAYGVVCAITLISNIKYLIANIQIKYAIFSLLFLFLIFNFSYYYHGYYAHYPYTYSGEWQYGYKDAISYVLTVEDDFDQIVITEALGRPYIYTLFYTKEDPSIFREKSQITREALGFVHVEGYGKYKFAKNANDVPNKGKRVLYVNSYNSLPAGAFVLKTFYLLNDNPILVVYTM